MGFYNEAIKNRYLETIENEGTRHVVSYIFKASKSAEEILESDLYNFSIEGIEQVMKAMNFKSNNSAISNMSHLANYISWSIVNGYREDNINPILGYDRKWAVKFVDRTTKIHFSYDEIIDLIEEFDNAQDQAMVMMWYLGAGGKNFSELKNLTYYDVDWNNNILTLKDQDGSIRKLELGNDEAALKCMRYLENAYKQQYYTTYNKSGIEDMPLFNSDYIFRNVEFKLTKEKGITTGVVYSRLANIKDKFDLEFLSQKSINQSGQLYMAYQIYMRDGNFGDKEQWYEIGERYNVSKLKSADKIYPNVSLMKQYITSENLKELYDVDIPIEIRKRTKK